MTEIKLSTHDIIICGGGMIGAATALQLASSGIRVALIESAAAGKFLASLRNFISNAKKELEKEFKIEEINELNNSINHVEKLMQNAPDKKITEEKNDGEKKIN